MEYALSAGDYRRFGCRLRRADATWERYAMIWLGDYTPDRFQLLFMAMVLDGLIGDMAWFFRVVPHPVAALGGLIGVLEKKLNRARRSERNRLIRGAVVVVLVAGLAIATGWAAALFVEAFRLWMLELLLVAVLLAQRSLYAHVRGVARALAREGLAAGRKAVAHIVGRDPEKLDRGGVARAAVESLAENFADGVVGPVFWYLLFGLPGLFFCKAVNTMDSMIGYRSERYRMFGRTAARLDDAVMWIPARLSVAFLIAAAVFAPSGRPLRAIRTIRRDAKKHPSVNAGWPEAAMAGALGFALGGPRVYDGGVQETVWIGDGRADLTPEDIRRALVLFMVACLICGLAVLAPGLLTA
jgi:adenosylcobinamide-phosphate synthase